MYMTDNIALFFSQITASLSADGLTAVYTSFVISFASVCAVIGTLKTDRRGKIIKIFCAAEVSAFFFFTAGILSVKAGLYFSAFYLSFSLGAGAAALCGLLFALSFERKVKKEEKALINLIDKKIKDDEVDSADFKREKNGDNFNFTQDVLKNNSSVDSQLNFPSVEEGERIVPPEANKNGFCCAQVNFNHVKNVIDRLDYYDVSSAEKKQIRELKSAVLSAEKYGINPILRESINDGLGALLKIMSRYGV